MERKKIEMKKTEIWEGIRGEEVGMKKTLYFQT